MEALLWASFPRGEEAGEGKGLRLPEGRTDPSRSTCFCIDHVALLSLYFDHFLTHLIITITIHIFFS